MAIPVANLPTFIPTTSADSPAGANTPTAGNFGDITPFQTVLASTQNQQATATAETATVTGLAAEDAVSEVDTALETETDATAAAADASLAGLLVFVTQVLSPPENAAVAQATGQAAEGLPASTGVSATAQASVEAGTDGRTRVDQLRLDRSTALPDTTAATAIPAAPTTSARVNPNAASATQIDTAVPVVTVDDVATPATIAARTATTAVPQSGSSIPAQAPIVANLIPPVSAPTNLSVEAPPVTEPTAAIAASALPSAQLGQRPATAGEQFVADATAGARLALPAPESMAFANTFAQEVTASVAPASAVPTTTTDPPLLTAPVGTVSVAEPLTPIAVAPVFAGADVGESAPTVTFGRAVADIARAVAQPSAPLQFATDVTVTRLMTEAPQPIEVPKVTDEPRSGDVASPSPVPGAPLPTSVAARSATAATTAVRPTPAAQISDTIVTHARVLEQNGRVEFQMRLDPPELGRLQIRLVARGDEMHGQVLVANEAVRGMIESQLPELRQRLEAAGVSVQSFDVSTDSGSSGRNPYRDAATEFLPRSTTTIGTVPQARIGRPSGSSSLDVTV